MAIEGIGASGLPRIGAESAQKGGAGFAAELSRFIEGVNTDQVEAASKIKALAVDGEGSIHDAMVAVSNAEGSFRLLMEIRNRLIDGVNRLLQSPS